MVESVDSTIQDSERMLHWLHRIQSATSEKWTHSTMASLTAALNRAPFVRRVRYPALWRNILKIHGLKVKPTLPAAETAAHSEYLVAVFQYEILAFYHCSVTSLHGGPLAVPQEVVADSPSATRDRMLRRLARTAVRTVYALGLDFALVHLALAPRGIVQVCGVEPFPTMPHGIMAKYAAALTDHAAAITELGEMQDIVLGLDAEFVLTTSHGELVPADRYLPASGPVGYDAAIVERQLIRALGELRPAPSHEPRRLFANLRRAMRLAAKHIDPALEWRAGGSPITGISLGFHLHFSGLPFTYEFVRTLDNYVALPLSLLEDPRSLARRHTFGWLGNARAKDHGGFEYRTPASILISPVITRGVLTLAKLIAVHYRQLQSRPLDNPAMQRAYYAGEKPSLIHFLARWKQDIMRLATLPNDREDLTSFLTLLESGTVWDESADIRRAWGVE